MHSILTLIPDGQFQPTYARSVRLIQTGHTPRRWWSISEIYILYNGIKDDRSEWKAMSGFSPLAEISREDVGHYYQNFFNNAIEIANYAILNYDRLLTETKEWQQLIF